MNSFVKKFTALAFSLFVSLGLFIVVVPLPVVHADSTYNLTYFNGTQHQDPYQSLSDCEAAMSTMRQQNHITIISCVPTDSSVQFYCYNVPINNNNGGYQTQCFTDEQSCEIYASSDADRTDSTTCTTQPTDTSGVHTGSINTQPPDLIKQDYQFLEPLTSGNDTFTVSKDLPSYIQGMYRLIISLSGVIAVVMIVYGGILYMSTDAIGKKQTGKAIITRTLWGLLLIIGSYLILVTINPTLVNLALPGSNVGSNTTQQNGNTTNNNTPPTTPTSNPPRYEYALTISNFGPTYQFDTITPLLQNESPAACQADAQANWSQPGGKNGYTYTASACTQEAPPTGDDPGPYWCTDLTVNGKPAGRDCSGGDSEAACQVKIKTWNTPPGNVVHFIIGQCFDAANPPQQQ